MPRTKINRKVVNTKRLRDNSAEIEEISRDFEIESENSLQMLQSEHNKSLRGIDATFEEIMKMIPPHVLHMKVGEVKKMKNFNEVLIDEKMSNLNVTVKETVTKGDEGYITEGASHRFTSGSESASNKSIHHNISVVGSLKKMQSSRRRSKSAVSAPSSVVTPGPRNMMMSAAKGKTPMAYQPQPAPHTSRSKYRTPMSNMTRQKAVSVDRIYGAITPKVNPQTPLSMLRHARVGEAAFSVTGSPIVPSNFVENTANVNIPVADGILSIRPESMDPNNLDPNLLQKIDVHTYNHLRTLKTNLDILMSGFSKKFYNH